uniref:Activin_recp domain-containing protein n=1 Tax=Steinernema glaseri TaxID=37863 RepID=A0A1I7Y993_9BILA
MRFSHVIFVALLTKLVLTLRCFHCGGQKVGFDQWMLSEGETCLLKRAKCLPNAHSCMVVRVKGSQNFSISGCSHDAFLGCDSNPVPFDSVVSRCQCDGDYCNLQWYHVPNKTTQNEPLPQFSRDQMATNDSFKLFLNMGVSLLLLYRLT